MTLLQCRHKVWCQGRVFMLYPVSTITIQAEAVWPTDRIWQLNKKQIKSLESFKSLSSKTKTPVHSSLAPGPSLHTATLLMLSILPRKSKMLPHSARGTAELILLPLLNCWCLQFRVNTKNNISPLMKEGKRGEWMRPSHGGAKGTLYWGMTSCGSAEGDCPQRRLLPVSNGCLNLKSSTGTWEDLRVPNPHKIPGLWLRPRRGPLWEVQSKIVFLESPQVSSGVSWWLKRALQGRAVFINNAFPLSCRNSGGRGTIRSAVNSLHSKSNRFVN